MYSNDKGSRFNFVDLIVKIIFTALFIFILVWLFQKYTPNMTPFYSNVFRENLEYMQKAGKSYFTTDKLPLKQDEEVKLTLAEMFDKKLLLPFVDKDGNSCNQYDSYVSVIKRSDFYELKVNLVCNEESDFIIEIMGCYDYCESDDCCKICGEEEKECTYEKIVKYQYKKKATKTSKSYSCDKGYTLKGSYCYKTSVVDTKSAIVKKSTTKIDTVPAKLVVIDGTSEEVKVIKTKAADKIEKVFVPVNKIKLPNKTSESCTTTTVPVKKKCDCTSRVVNGQDVITCNTCTEYIEKETCTQSTISGGYRWECPSIATGSTGSGSSLTCYYNNVIPGSYSYSCPVEATHYTGSGASLKCFTKTSGTSKYECEDKSYTLKGDKCEKEIKEESTSLSCDKYKGYKPEGNKCVKYETDKVKAKAKTKKTTYWKYKWSEKTSLSGWTKTGKTKTVNGEKVCK